MSQTGKVGTVATSVFFDSADGDGKYKCIHHSTPVVVWDDEHIKLNTGGWRTVTTKLRMNQVSNQYGLGYQVWQEKGEWYVLYMGRVKTMLSETMVLYRDPAHPSNQPA